MRVSCKVLFGAVLMLLLHSCVKDEYDLDKFSSKVDVNTAVAIPIASGQIKLQQVLPKGVNDYKYFYFDSNDLLHLVYQEKFDDLTMGMYDKFIRDAYNSTTISLPGGAPFPLNVQVDNQMSATVDVILDKPDQVIESALLEKGALTFTSTSSFPGNFSYAIETPDLLTANKQNFTLSHSHTSGTKSTTVDLAGCTLKPTADRKLRFTIKYSLKKTAAGTGTDKITLSCSMNNLRIVSLEGYLGQIQVNLQNNKLPINFSNMVDVGGEFDIKNPVISLVFRNQGNVPFNFMHNGVKAVRDANVYNITGVPSPIKVYAPVYGVEEEKKSTADIDKTTNIIQVLSKFPKEVVFDGYLLANPSDMPVQKNYISKTDTLHIDALADLPFDIRLSDIVFKDTASYNFSSLVNDANSVDEMKVRYIIKNGFPFECAMTVFILDDKGKQIDVAFEKPFVVGAAVLQNGVVSSPTASQIDVTYGKDRIQKLKAGKRIVLVATLNTVGSKGTQTVQFLSKHHVDVVVLGFIKANLNNL